MPQPSEPPAHAPHGPLPEGGSARPMTRWGTPVMHRPQRSVTAYDDELRSLVADMVATMYAADGVGLAACQIGLDQAVFVFDCPDSTHERTVGVVCNPVLTLPEGRDRKLDVAEEGCLSFPGAFVECPRPDFATVTGTGLDGEPVTFSGDGLLARCLQHETDHTRGTVFGDRLSTKLRKKLQKQHDQAAEDYPAGWPLEGAPSEV
jgi:peptide deformylase